MEEMVFFWMRRDLRLADNAGLFQALKSGHPVQPVFIFDTDILQHLPETDQRVRFIHQEVQRLERELRAAGSTLFVRHGKPVDIWRELLNEFPGTRAVYANRDYEPYAKTRDEQVATLAREHGAGFHLAKDQVIFHQNEILTRNGDFYAVFSPYKRNWLGTLRHEHLAPAPSADYLTALRKTDAPKPPIALEEMGFRDEHLQDIPARQVSEQLMADYDEKRDYPALQATSRIGIHLRFGTVSIRRLANKAKANGMAFLNELIWRDFYMHVLDHNPQVVDTSFRPEYDTIPWRNNEDDFARWCEGKTGYPIVDAGMRQLNAIGYMHNRVRMITASFLTKHLLIDWRWGERYFAEKLLDYELSSNNGGWQWAAGSGTDAAPYFRIFNPTTQIKKFDPQKEYIRKWVPEFDSMDYPEPIVEHKAARERALKTYKTALDKAKGKA